MLFSFLFHLYGQEERVKVHLLTRPNLLIMILSFSVIEPIPTFKGGIPSFKKLRTQKTFRQNDHAKYIFCVLRKTILFVKIHPFNNNHTTQILTNHRP